MDNLVVNNQQVLGRQLLLWRLAVAVLLTVYLGFSIFDIANDSAQSFVWLGVFPALLVALLIAASGQEFLTQSEKFAAINHDRSLAKFFAAQELVAIAKTGTLTKAQAKVYAVQVIGDGLREYELVALAASVETHSSHSIGKAINEYAEVHGLQIAAAKDFRVIPGVGVVGIVDGHSIQVGGPSLLTSRNLTLGVDHLIRANAENEAGHTVVYVVRDSELLGFIATADSISDIAAELIFEIQSMRKHVAVVSGDAQGVVKWVAEQLNIAKYFGEVLPHQLDSLLGQLINGSQKLVYLHSGSGESFEAGEGLVVKLTANLSMLVHSLKRARMAKARKRLGYYLGAALLLASMALAFGLFAAAGAVASFVIGMVLISLSVLVFYSVSFRK